MVGLPLKLVLLDLNTLRTIVEFIAVEVHKTPGGTCIGGDERCLNSEAV